MDESALTGESLPVEKGPGDKVIGRHHQPSRALLTSRLCGWATTPPWPRSIRLVDDATSSKAPIAKLADRVAGVFVPVVIGIAVVAAVVWLYRHPLH